MYRVDALGYTHGVSLEKNLKSKSDPIRFGENRERKYNLTLEQV